MSLKPMSVLRPRLKTESICMFSANSAARKKMSFFYHVYGSDPKQGYLARRRKPAAQLGQNHKFVPQRGHYPTEPRHT